METLLITIRMAKMLEAAGRCLEYEQLSKPRREQVKTGLERFQTAQRDCSVYA